MAPTLNPHVRRRFADAGIVLAAFGFSYLQLELGGGFGDFSSVSTAPDALAYALGMLSAVALLWRRRHPWGVLSGTLILSLGSAALGYGVHAPLAPAIALYSIAATQAVVKNWEVAVTATAGWVALITIEMAATPYGIPDYVVPALIWAGAWLLGDRRRILSERAVDRLEGTKRERMLAIAEERARIARELHDSAGHAINTILVQAGAARVLWDRDEARAKAAVRTIEDVARETMEEVDRIVGVLHEDPEVDRSPLPGIEQILALVERQRTGGLDIDLTIAGESDRPPPVEVSRAIYRIAQESLTNASKHGAGHAAVAVEYGGDALKLKVSNPIALKTEPRSGGGRGIAGMRERAILLGGTLSADRAGRLFKLEAELPYGRDAR